MNTKILDKADAICKKARETRELHERLVALAKKVKG